jgi:asparagine synthase (glutamine-hydrolysing)
MCGIAGFLTYDESPPDPTHLRRMCDAIEHRGPDAFGSYCRPGVALGHRRLSIIDVEGGAQPLGNEDGSLQIIFNGEIYNYLELRRDLVSKGHHLKTGSDTEVIIHLYEEVGTSLPEYLNGMFAFAIWDASRKELFLARDRFGKKPLYYASDLGSTRFCFASELKALATLPGFDGEVNWKSVVDFLSLSYVPEPQSIYRGIEKLPPAHSLLVTRSDYSLRRYWQPAFSPDAHLHFESAVQQVHELAIDCVKRRMIADVPLGAFLSGGVDSATAVGIMAGAATGPVKTFSIGFSDKRFDELEYARAVARRYATDHAEEVVTPSIHEMLGTLVRHFDEPFADSSAVPTLYLARMTRRHVTVALCGDGADELFAGYRRHRHAVAEERVRSLVPGWFRHSVFGLAGEYYPKFDYLPRIFRAKTVLSNLSRELADAYFTSRSTFRDTGLVNLLSDEARQAVGDYSPRADFTRRFAKYKHLGPLEQLQAVDLETWLPGDILVKADRATMAYSLEGRSPWLDYRLAELAFRLPPSFKLYKGIGKYILKIMARAYVPDDLLWRPKMGFSVPLASWFRTSLRAGFETLVLSPDMEQYLALGEVRRLWQEHQSGEFNHDQKLWALLMFACWDVYQRRGSRQESLVAALSA